MAHTEHQTAPAGSLGPIPDKLYFRIGEVARLLDVAPHVLRFWESEFPQLRPTKGGTGQRLYRRRDVEMAIRIRELLYDRGFTIPGARQHLKSESRHTDPLLPFRAERPETEPHTRQLRRMRTQLLELSAMLALPAPGTPAERNRRSVTEMRRQFRRSSVTQGASLFGSPETESDRR